MKAAGADRTVDRAEARQLRLRAQGLVWPASGASPDSIAAALCGIQAQDTAGAALSFSSRAEDLHPQFLDQAIRDRRLVRTWAMRGTLHLLAAPDVRWLLALLAPVFTRPSARHRQLGLDAPTLGQAMAILREALHGGQERTRAELGAVLRASGVAPDGQRLPHILSYASLRGLLCQGPPREAEPTYVLLDDWLPPESPTAPTDRLDALGQLARRYLAGYGPADLPDFAWWSGLPMADARPAWDRISREVVTISTAGRRYSVLASADDREWRPNTTPASASARLLPGFDSYLLGYRDRSLILEPALAPRVNAGGGMLKSTVVFDGRVVGIWSRTIVRRRLDVTVTPFERLGADAAMAITAEAMRLGRHVEQAVTLTIADPP
jgi:hypothetical protein